MTTPLSLIEKLRLGHTTTGHKMLGEAAERIEELEAALKPFAYYAEQIPDDVSDTASASGTVGDLRKAREVLGEKWGEK